jgi:putative oxidoreductase
MPIVFVIGRVVFVLYFIFAGLQRLMNVTASADYFAQKFVIPTALAALASQAENLFGLSTPQMLAVMAGAIELAAGLLIAFNVGTRTMAIVLIVFTGFGIYYGYDFWAMAAAPERDVVVQQVMLHLALIGGLLVFVALGYSRPGEPPRRADV